MSEALNDEDLFLAGVMSDPANDVPEVLPELLTQPWRAALLSAARDTPGDQIGALQACQAAMPGHPWIEHLERVMGIRLLVTKTDMERIGETLIDRGRKWQLMQVYAKACEACRKDGETAAQIQASTQQALSQIEIGSTRGAIVHVSDVMAAAVEDLQQRMDGTKPVLTTGIASLDKALGGGLEPGWMVVVGARPKMGKTGFAGLVSQANAKAKNPVFGCELEMSAPQQGRRIISRSGGPTLERVRMPRFEDDMVQIRTAYNKTKDLPWHFSFTCRSMDQVESAFRQWRAGHTDLSKPAVGILDYLQLAEATDKRNREREVADMARRCKLMAKELGIVLLVLSQLNREVERRDPPRPQASDLRESGAIEQDADAILMLYRPSVYGLPGPDGRPDDEAVEILIPAQREGASGESVWARFIGERATFEERKQ